MTPQVEIHAQSYWLASLGLRRATLLPQGREYALETLDMLAGFAPSERIRDMAGRSFRALRRRVQVIPIQEVRR